MWEEGPGDSNFAEGLGGQVSASQLERSQQPLLPPALCCHIVTFRGSFQPQRDSCLVISRWVGS